MWVNLRSTGKENVRRAVGRNEVDAIFGNCDGFVPTSLRRRTAHGLIVGVRARQVSHFPTFMSALIPTYDSVYINFVRAGPNIDTVRAGPN